MADEKVEQKPTQPAPDQAAPADKPADKGKSKSFLPMIIIAVVVLVCAGAGIGLGLLFAGGKADSAAPAQPTNHDAQGQTAAHETEAANAAAAHKADAQTSTSGEIWYFDLEPVVANLNEPGATRYVRAAITLEISPELSSDKGTTLLTQKKPLLINLMTIYLAGLNVDATRGDKNLKKIQSEICDSFNERLFPDSKPLIKGILIKEFAVQ